MPEIQRTRDLVIFRKASSLVVTVSPEMATNGWAGGQGVQWDESARDEFAVTYSDGHPAGFLIWGSDEEADRYTSLTRNQPAYKFGVMAFGGWILSLRTYERYTYATRDTANPVPLVYEAQDDVFFSLRGWVTNEDEWTLSGDPRAPNVNIVGVVVQPPSPETNDFLTVAVRL